ncbi:hypothetical protein, partial [Desulfosporosinus fructosivorans]|uniref:hypothetical protein n=1 Tax=Desulfosporosinus fructosivorans TaxID=2018669 RepID=UPI001A7EB5DD
SSPGKHAKSYLLGDSFFVLSYTVIWGRGSTRSSTLLEIALWVAVWRKSRPTFVLPGKQAKCYLLGGSFFVLNYTVIWGRVPPVRSTRQERALLRCLLPGKDYQ